METILLVIKPPLLVDLLVFESPLLVDMTALLNLTPNVHSPAKNSTRKFILMNFSFAPLQKAIFHCRSNFHSERPFAELPPNKVAGCSGVQGFPAFCARMAFGMRSALSTECRGYLARAAI
jgi:hypothetical protein